MRIVGLLLLGVASVASILGCGGGDGDDTATKQVLVVDPAHDVAAGSKGDLAAASIVEEGSGLQFAARFVPGEFDPARSNVVLVIDIDMDPLTGDRKGFDYIVEMGSTCLQGKAILRRYEGIRPWSSTMGQYDVTFRPDGMTTTVPVAALEGYTGAFSFRLESAREIEWCGYTGLLDSMPDEGEAPAVFR